jgi:ribokinase
MYDVITVGSATVDVFAHAKFSETITITEPKGKTTLLAFPLGAKIIIEDLDFTVGGGGTNTAVAFARLGFKTGYIGKLGKGTNSDFIHKNLEKENVDLLCAHGDGLAGYSVILDSMEHDRTILAYKGANDHLQNSEVPYAKLKSLWIYLSAMMGDSFETAKQIAAFAERKGISLAFNPSLYLAERGMSYLAPLLTRVELLVLNKEEAFCLSKKNDIAESLRKLHAAGAKIIVVTDGKNPLYVFDGILQYRCIPPHVNVVDATGAGDAFAATFMAGLLLKRPIEDCIKMALVNASSVLQHHGAKNILLGKKELLSQAAKLRIKISKRPL